jgi:peptidyl-prolyl cis-trans isomerase SurA
MRLRLLIAAAALAAGTGMAGSAPPAAAETPFRPVAVVNDVAITGFDLEQRTRILTALGYPAEDAGALRAAALQQLIDEKLKLQAARRAGVEITPEMVQGAVEEFASRAGIQPEEFRALLSAQGVSDQALEDMARAEIGWLQVLRDRFGDQIEPAESEVEAELASLGNGAATEYRVLEIGLPLETGDRTADETRTLAEQLYESLGAGGSFEEAVARYSSSPSAAQGGQVGWVSIERMPPELRQSLEGLEVGEVSRPIPVPGGLSILKVVDKRASGQPTGAAQPTREAVRARLVSQRSVEMANDLLEEMRREALIEVR